MKRIFTLLLTVALLLGAVGCGSEGEKWQEQYDLGVRYLSEGNYEEAILAFTAAIEIDPKQTLAYIGRGEAYIGSGETEENLAAALTDYEKAVELDEINADAWLGLADVYIRRSEFDKAEEVLRQALEKAADSGKIQEKLDDMEKGNISDASGKIHRESYYEDGKLTWYAVYTYDEQGRQETITSYDEAGAQIDFVEMRYDERGNQVYGWVVSVEGEFTDGAFEYNEQNQMIRATYLEGPSGDVFYEYDAKGNQIKETYYDQNKLSVYIIIREYNDQNRVISEQHYNVDGTLTQKVTWEYDEDGRERQNLYDSNGELDSYAIYDENGSKIYDQDGKLLHETVYS